MLHQHLSEHLLRDAGTHLHSANEHFLGFVTNPFRNFTAGCPGFRFLVPGSWVDLRLPSAPIFFFRPKCKSPALNFQLLIVPLPFRRKIVPVL